MARLRRDALHSKARRLTDASERWHQRYLRWGGGSGPIRPLSDRAYGMLIFIAAAAILAVYRSIYP